MSWGNPQTTTEHLQATLLKPLAAIYGACDRLHKLAYTSGLRRIQKLSVPVISVGNITCGGTGKTPLVVDISRFLSDQGLKVGVLSSGYARQSKSMVMVSDGKGNFASVLDSGDEPLLIAKANPDVVVFANKNRYKAGIRAIEEHNCDVLLLDDGFQHYPLHRDLDLVLIDYDHEPLRDSILPAGRLRESLEGLARASQLIITKVPTTPNKPKLEILARLAKRFAPQADIAQCRFIPKQLHGFSNGGNSALSIETLRGKKVITFCGLAQPAGFASQVEALGAKVVDKFVFPDHHWYSQQDLAQLNSKLVQHSADFFVTTEKDLIKLQSLPTNLKILAIELETQWLTQFPTSVQELVVKMRERSDSNRPSNILA